MSQPPSGGCVLKPCRCIFADGGADPAAFGRLCVETLTELQSWLAEQQVQPPSGGCVLKHWQKLTNCLSNYQPPSGGCVLKLACDTVPDKPETQPPSGGCVLKLWLFAKSAE